MNLTKALGLKGGESIAFVGAGGKTSTMYSLAHELAPLVVLTTTTHLGVWQAELAEDHHIIQIPDDISRLKFEQNGILLLTGPARADDRFAGLDQKTLKALQSVCKQGNISLLIEADGARQRSLKAPAAHEPAIPAWVDLVVVMAGLKGLGERLDADSVHRPEIFSQLAGLPMGEVIRVSDVAAVLASQQGGLKGFPEGCQRVLFLNQAEGLLLMSIGGRMARGMVEVFDRVLVGSLHQPNQEGPIFSVHTRTGGIILAAGGSERLGRPKQLLSWQGVPFLLQVVQNALAAGLAPLIVVTGADRTQVEIALGDLPVKFVHNPDWAEGQSTSMRAGLAALPDRCEGVLFLLSDQPQISPILIRQLIERHAQDRALVTAPMIGGQRGNPVLFDRETFEALSTVQGDMGGRAVFDQFGMDWLPWVDERILMDVDVETDLDKLIQAYYPDDLNLSHHHF